MHLLLAGSFTLHVVLGVERHCSLECVGSEYIALLPSGSLCIEKVLSFSISQRVLSDPNGEVKVQILELCCKKELNLSSSNIYIY